MKLRAWTVVVLILAALTVALFLQRSKTHARIEKLAERVEALATGTGVDEEQVTKLVESRMVLVSQLSRLSVERESQKLEIKKAKSSSRTLQLQRELDQKSSEITALEKAIEAINDDVKDKKIQSKQEEEKRKEEREKLEGERREAERASRRADLSLILSFISTMFATLATIIIALINRKKPGS